MISWHQFLFWWFNLLSLPEGTLIENFGKYFQKDSTHKRYMIRLSNPMFFLLDNLRKTWRRQKILFCFLFLYLTDFLHNPIPLIVGIKNLLYINSWLTKRIATISTITIVHSLKENCKINKKLTPFPPRCGRENV